MADPQLQNSEFLAALLNAMPAMILVSDAEGYISMVNRAASETLGCSGDPGAALSRHGDILHCVNAGGGCGRGKACADCVLRGTVARALEQNRQQRTNADMLLRLPGKPERPVNLSLTATPFEFNGQRLVLLALQDITELVQLRSLIPICANCKKVRNDDNYWQHVETYFREHAPVDFSHSICPECMKTLYGDILDAAEDAGKGL